MAIKEVKRDEIERKRVSYAAEIVKEFIDSGFDAALVDIPEGKTAMQVYRTLKFFINYNNLGDVVCMTRRGDKIYLLKK